MSVTSTPVVTPVPIVITTGTGYPTNFTSSAGPFNNGTTKPIEPTKTDTPVVVNPTEKPMPTVPEYPTAPIYSGAAAPEFGTAGQAYFAGAVGFMGLVFAVL